MNDKSTCDYWVLKNGEAAYLASDELEGQWTYKQCLAKKFKFFDEAMTTKNSYMDNSFRIIRVRKKQQQVADGKTRLKRVLTRLGWECHSGEYMCEYKSDDGDLYRAEARQITSLSGWIVSITYNAKFIHLSEHAARDQAIQCADYAVEVADHLRFGVVG